MTRGELIESGAVFASPAPLSQAIRAGDYLFISGQIGSDGDGRMRTADFKDEVHVVIQNLERILDSAGGTLADVRKVNVFLTSTELFEQFNALYSRIFGVDGFPARTTVLRARTTRAPRRDRRGRVAPWTMTMPLP